MKTLAVQKEIVNKYVKLSKSAKLPFDKKNGIEHFWGLNSKVGNKNYFISECGNISIEMNKKNQTGNFFKDIAIDLYNGVAKFFDAEIKITDNNIQKIKKPLFNSWSETLVKINNILEHANKNINDNNIVEKKQTGILCFSEKQIKQLQGTYNKLIQEKKL